MSTYLREMMFVLNVEPYREHDAWITGFSKQSGKIQAIARGVRRTQAKQLGHLEPLQFSEVMLAKGKAYDHIAVARSMGPVLKSRHRMGSLVVLKAFADCVDRLTHPNAQEPTLFAFIQEVVRVWEGIDQEIGYARGEYALSVAIYRVLDILGIAPPLDRCSYCRKDLTAECAFMLKMGSCYCSSCATSTHDGYQPHLIISSSARKVLHWLSNASYQQALALTLTQQHLTEITHVIQQCLHHAPMQGTYRGMEYLRVLS